MQVAAIYHEGGQQGDELMRQIIQAQVEQGCRIHGMMTSQGKDLRSQQPMSVEDIVTGDIFIISEVLGKDSKSCALDLGSLSATSAIFYRAIESRADLVFVNRFGHAEANNQGLNQEILAVIEANIPLLVLVSPKYTAAWEDFIGDFGAYLPVERQAIEQWMQACYCV